MGMPGVTPENKAENHKILKKQPTLKQKL